MDRKDIISKITEIVSKYGDFTTAQVNADSSPILFSGCGVIVLVEDFDKDTATVYSYLDGNGAEIGNQQYKYEDLSDDVLASIYELACDWESENLDN